MPKFILSVRYDPNTHTEYKMHDIYEETRNILIDYGIEIPDKLNKPEIWLQFEDTFLQRRALKHVYMHILNKYVRIYGSHHDRKEGINAFIFDSKLFERWFDHITDDHWRKDSMAIVYRNMFRMTKSEDMVPVYLVWVNDTTDHGVCLAFPFYVQKRRKEKEIW